MSRGGGGHCGFGAFRFRNDDGGNQGLNDGNEAVNGAEIVGDDCYGSP